MAEPSAKVARISQDVVVMMNGLSGAMGQEVAQACLRAGYSLAEVSLTGPSNLAECEVKEGALTAKIKLVGPREPGAQKKVLEDAVKRYGNRLVIIDFTHPKAVNSNAELYCSTGAAFVMGTTGGDREALMKSVSDSGAYAVIAPNMSKQIVALQATFQKMGTEFPGAYSGYTLKITESHQKTKADTSGTAKAMVSSFQQMGLDFNIDQIDKVRDPTKQVEFGVPEKDLDGHAFHTYALTSGDGSVNFQFQHNVCGRRTYGEGAVDAVTFLNKQRVERSEKKLFSMIDVLEAGAMR